MAVAKLNKRLLRRVRHKIATAPEAYDQTEGGEKSEVAPCGTAACIAGWAVALSLPKNGPKRIQRMAWRRIQERAIRLLGISTKEAETLFNPHPNEGDGWDWQAWPEKFAKQWARVKTPKAKANVAIRYLDHIIKTGKVTE